MNIEEQADILLNRCNDANGATYVFNVEDVRAVAQLALCKPVTAQTEDHRMARRDWFALAAMVALITNDKECEMTEETIARVSFVTADAMEKARVQK